MKTAEIFSKQSREYAKFRPHYPDDLYEYLATLTPEHSLAWDCGTGNGQAAVRLAERFAAVLATDPNEKQLASQMPHPRVKYAKGAAESSPNSDRSVDLITCAQAFHWFDHERFFKEVARVLKPAGAVAVWCYGLCAIDPEIDAIVFDYYEGALGPYWEPQRKLVEEGYRNCHFPLKELTPPRFEMAVDWSLDQLVGYLSTWSALQTYLGKNSDNPLEVTAKRLKSAWGSSETRPVVWPLSIRVGKLT